MTTDSDDQDPDFQFFEDDLPSEKAGEKIGRYTLVEEIGRGGFGAVWMADQQEPVRRRVALKIIKLGMDTRQVVARFEQERQALALMDHPNVARVLDGGATATGRPYFVMDLVRGEPIGEYCDGNRLTIDERLALFGQVCNAIQHAHSKGIIHRDIKPSNVLVSTQDGRPHATVIDFGIAKATSQRLTDKTLFTAQQQVIGTVQYMSPEQAEGSLDIDTRSDVYSLGVLLYEILTGTTPFDQDTVKRAMFQEVQRLIREVEPPKPSSRITQSRDTLPGLAATRRVEPGRLGSLVRGELDWIVMKALEKDRSRRYETANGLAMDIRRYLAGEAVVAAPPSALYRLRKLVLRNKSAVAAVLAIAAALVIGVVAFAWQANVAQTERDAARLAQQAETQERRRAESNERKAGAINQFLLDMLGSADMRNLGREARVSQALDRAGLSVGESFQDRPEVEAAVREILGKTYISLGMLDQAEPHVVAAVDLARSVHGDESPEYARSLGDRGALERGRGRHGASAGAYEEALEIARRVRGPEDSLTLSMQADYGNTLVVLKRNGEAEALFRETLATHRRVVGRDTRQTLVLVNSLAVLLHGMERLDEAEQLYREALEIGERVLGQDHPDTLIARMNLGSMLRARGKLGEAEPLLAGSCAGIRKTFGDAHPKTAEAASILASLYFDSGRIKDSLPLYEECVAIRRRAEGERTAGVAEAKQALALALSRLGERARSVALEREALDVWIALEGPDGPKALYCRLELANTLTAADQESEAEPLFRDVLDRAPRVLGEDHQTTIIATNSYAVLLLRQKRYADAEPYLRKALETGRRAQGADHRNTLITQYNLSCALRETGRLDEAESLGRDTLDRFVRAFGARHANLATAHSGLGETLAKLGRTDEARSEFVEAIAISKEALGEQHPGFASSAYQLGRIMIDTGHADEAEPMLREVVGLQTQARGPGDRRTAYAKVEHGHCLAVLRRFSEAEPLLVDGHAGLTAAHPEGHDDVRRAERRLADLYAAWNAAEPDAGRAARAAAWKARAESAPASKPVGGR